MREKGRISVKAISEWMKWPEQIIRDYVLRNRKFIPTLSGWTMSHDAAIITAVGVYLNVKFDHAAEFYHKTRRLIDANRTAKISS
jgi:hypothetical protein